MLYGNIMFRDRSQLIYLDYILQNIANFTDVDDINPIQCSPRGVVILRNAENKMLNHKGGKKEKTIENTLCDKTLS